jgi:hypothetical protein
MTLTTLDDTAYSSPVALSAPADAPGALVASSGISLLLWRLYAQFWLVCLLFPIVFLARAPLPAVRLITAVAGLALYVMAYTWCLWPHPANRQGRAGPGPHLSIWLFIGLAGLALILSLAYGTAFLWLLVGVSAVAVRACRARRGWSRLRILASPRRGQGLRPAIGPSPRRCRRARLRATIQAHEPQCWSGRRPVGATLVRGRHYAALSAWS